MNSIKNNLAYSFWLMTMTFMLVFPTRGVHAMLPGLPGDSAPRRLIMDIQQNQILVWELNIKYDPYDNGQILRTNPDRPVFLMLAMDRSFTILDGDTRREGSWCVDIESGTLTLKGEKVNDQLMPDKSDQVYMIKTYDDQGLVLAWQGRHGWVDMVYAPVDTSKVKLQTISSNK